MRKSLLFLIFVFLSLSSLAQDKRLIEGTVTSTEDGAVFPGVSVVVSGTSKGTVTNTEGKYSIQVDANENVLIFSFVGMLPIEERIDNRLVINVAMNPDVSQLSEVVVVGYGTEHKKMLTGSVGVVKSDAIKDLPVSTVDGILQGQTAGVQVMQNSGTPGGGMSVRVRGTTSLSGSGQPLYVIDGIPVTTGDYAQVGYEGQGINALSDLNPSEIESVSVLKDAAAAALYGARGSNGIVLITTKRGKSGKSQITFNTYSGVQQVWRTLDMLNAQQWMEYRNDLAGTTVFTEDDMKNNTIDTDWQDVIFRTAPITNYDLSASGGNEKTRFFISGSYFDQEGILIGTGFKRLNTRVNLDHTISNKLKVGTSIGLSYSKSDRVESDASLHGPLPNGISTPAIFPVYNPDGSYNQDGPYSNALSIANEATNENFTYRAIANVFAEYTILPGLTFSSKWGVDFYNLREHAFEFNTVQGSKYNGLGFETFRNVLNVVSNNILRYETTFDLHNIELMGGYSFEMFENHSMYARGQDFADESLQYLNAATTFVGTTASPGEKGIQSFFGKVNYNYASKYLLGITARVDASTNFGDNNKYGIFPAASLAWRMSEEDFIKNNITAISELKLRGSYGLLGNDNIESFLFAPLYTPGSYSSKPAISPKHLPNPDLKWESTAQLDIGIEIGLFNDLLTLTADYYNKQTKDLLLDQPLPPSSGFPGVVTNIGKMENKGIELSAGVNTVLGPVRWTSNFNISFNRNKVKKLYDDQPMDDLGRGGNRVMVGQPLAIFYNYKSLGVDPSTGDIVFADTNIDGEITSEDRTIIGNPNPKYIGGFTNTFAYKGFDLSVFLQFTYGNDVFNGSRLFLESLQGGDNQIEAVTRRWKNPGDITDIPRATSDASKAAENKRASSRFIEDGSYLRIKNVTLGYNFNREIISKINLTGLRIYASTQNLFTFTNYNGLDPEVNYSGNSLQVVGTDFFTFPQARTFTLGLNVKF
ncbi:SusC/RagA family TonB-linked outer membrane protein [Pseudochryseolinea flava]|uniref:SusC/RagA family TonB-linked outer membrane protein n=1 Tax=Pseudochryseolinea flava TaxID=2059302 RepID=A0A364XV17_9BACT|nr:TonB-dependent receptor [Pseudochryseolinea flava]RAV98172.1 SusC/RagA family TonB-linked outer membrane protein [Pseudochryseolinea flava]